MIMPGDVRNDLYLILEKGEFERGGKSTGKNIEVTISVLDGEKNIIKVRMTMIDKHYKRNNFFCRIVCGERLVWKDVPNTIQ